MMVVTALEVDGPVVAVVAMPLEVVAVAMTMVAVVISVVMPEPVLVPLRRGRPGEQHESGGDQTCDAKLHRMTFRFMEARSLGLAL
ncbi:hypothetical protein [Methylorubrum extorquens]|jgi:hypothetical protein|nr:hypothetical protein [Methylorubrum extorquens]